jgi:hypothetical protein
LAVERALPCEEAEDAMSKTKRRGKKELEPRKLRLIKGGLWGANPKVPEKAWANRQYYPMVVITT